MTTINKKIILITDSYFPSIDSTSQFNTKIIDYLSNFFNVGVLVPSYRLANKEKRGNIEIIRYPILFSKSRNLIEKLIKFLSLIISFSTYLFRKNFKNHIILVHTSPPILVIYIVLIFKIKKIFLFENIKLILLGQDIYPDELEIFSSKIKEKYWYKLLSNIYGRAYRKYDFIIACSKPAKNKLNSKYKVLSKKIKVVNNWSLIPESALKEYACPFYNLKSKQIKLVYIGNIGVLHMYSYTSKIVNILMDDFKQFDHFDVYARGVNKIRFLDLIENKEKLRNNPVIHPEKLVDVYCKPSLTIVPLTKQTGECAFPSRIITAISLGSPILLVTDTNVKNDIAKLIEKNKIGFVISQNKEKRDILRLKRNLEVDFKSFQENCLDLYKKFQVDKGLESIFKVLNSIDKKK